jgi:4'-phosphopantetheinyl transferase
MSKTSQPSWRDRFKSLQQQAHVWYCNPQVIFDTGKLEHYFAMLSSAERKQQRKFHFKKDQRSYLVSHALVRTVLSLYADIAPQDWVFSRGAHGKPRLTEASAATSLRFNLTHTADLCACVVTRSIRCGVDAEHVGRENKLMPIARRMFSDMELATLHGKTDAEIQQRFFYYWTLREAYVKAKGTGLGGSSKAFHFRVDEQPDTAKCMTASIEFIDGKKKNIAAEWQFEIFQHNTDHVMAVALKSTGEHKTIQWQFMEP